ncbi:hypothetical protein DYD21_19090 [Rhodohalobacter sp. SW132]|uniref:hypothetical protein n=1 Tax=Rhodohalobacter sp. SW132 TaxID=2293433 RepID=UPI000E288F13|nr:hypothetical protein [Rhodohalobacter sp. SW132]REL24313.1 hypothetical protein DYD21_19090 [Rhodohalobacter sp. SW132]
MGKVNRCICSNIRFEEVLADARRLSIKTVEELRDREICAVNCRLCEPYLERMLKTGETEFDPGSLFSSAE